MATLIAVYNSEGCVARCDAKCYNATSLKCDCICGGRNHGVGFHRAVEQTRENATAWAEFFIERKDIKDARTELGGDVRQLSLF